MKRISVKLGFLIILIIFISSIVSVIVSTIFGYNFKREIKDNQYAMSNAASLLLEDHRLTIDQVHDVLQNTVFLLTQIDTLEEVKLSPNAKSHLLKDGIYHFDGTIHQLPYTLFIANDQYFLISFDGHASLVKTIASRIGLTALSYVVVGIILTVLVVKKMVAPLIKLTEATKEVAKGNFKVQVKSKGKDEIRMLTDHFNTMARELEHIEVLRKDFISNFSHEFKTPLASIQGFAKLLGQETITTEEQQEYAAIIVEETQRLSHLASNILKLTKLENQEIIARTTSFSLDEQMRHSILLLEREWSDKALELDLSLDQVTIEGDEALLSLVWINLLENAIKFSSKHQTLRVTLKKDKRGAEVTIQDQGIGMAVETQKRVFEKFYQGDLQHAEKGNGLGLSLVKRVVDLHKGQIILESKPGHGSSFKINLP